MLEGGSPIASLRAEMIDVGFAKILEGPIFGGVDVARDEAIEILFGKRLLGKESERILRRGPDLLCGLFAQATDGTGLRIDRDYKMACVNFRAVVVRF